MALPALLPSHVTELHALSRAPERLEAITPALRALLQSAAAERRRCARVMDWGAAETARRVWCAAAYLLQLAEDAE